MLALAVPAVVEAPQLGALVLRVPLAELVTERDDSLLGASFLLISPTAAARVSERGATRADDRFSQAAMEDRKREGYF